MATFNDNSLMPFGKFQGKKMCEVPCHYLLWCEAQTWIHSPVSADLKRYIENNKTILLAEKKRSANYNGNGRG